jgi:hypothetical protein
VSDTRARLIAHMKACLACYRAMWSDEPLCTLGARLHGLYVGQLKPEANGER